MFTGEDKETRAGVLACFGSDQCIEWLDSVVFGGYLFVYECVIRERKCVSVYVCACVYDKRERKKERGKV